MSINFLLLLVILAVVGGPLAAGDVSSGVIIFLFVVAGWVVSLCLHEFGHAFVAHRSGDTTVKAKGYLTLDPVRYADPLTSVILPVAILAMGGIGFPGGAVYIRRDLILGKAARALVSIAGPVMTGVALVLFALPLQAADAIAPAFRNALAVLLFLQATALLLNLLPVPGLDGFGVLEPLLPASVWNGAQRFGGFAIMGLFALLLLVPEAARPLFAAALAITDVFHVQRGWIVAGFEAFRFWEH